MVIVFYLLDQTDKKFKKVYFVRWEENKPMFTDNKGVAKRYWHEELAEKDISQLRKAVSDVAVTLNIEMEVLE